MSEQPSSSQEPAPRASGGAWSRAEIDAAIAGLDQATHAFSERVRAMQSRSGAALYGPPAQTAPEGGAPAQTAPEGAVPPAADAGAGPRAPGGEPTVPPAPRHEQGSGEDRGASFDRRMQEAEREAREYLQQAKQRADSLVRTMIGAVERESAEIRREAELGIRDRWRAVEIEAGRYLDDAKQVADGMVAERQERIRTLSDGVVARGQALTAGMDDADRIQRQFESFVRALSETASRIAAEGRPGDERRLTRLDGLAGLDRGDAVAA